MTTGPRYLIRLDDACPTMERQKWRKVEDMLDELNIKPIVAVVPENQDPDLICDGADRGFWSKVRRWQAKGWTIALHGHRHVMHHTNSQLLLPFYNRSEFGGLPYDEQAEKLRLAWNCFVAEGVEPTVWVAPAHSFDRLTLEAVRNETPIRIVSDGIARNQYFQHQFFWIPQQLWDIKAKSSGLWTVCLHPNTMTDTQIDLLFSKIRQCYLPKITNLIEIELHAKKKTLADKYFEHYFWRQRQVIHYLIRLRTWIHNHGMAIDH